MIGEPVTVLRAPTTEDRYHNVVPDWSAATETTVQGWAVSPRYESEDRTEGRQGRVIGFTLYREGPAPDILATDRLRVRGQVHEVDGEPQAWVEPWTTTPKGIEVQTRRVEG